jgi:small-conductance mechanosensitive channel
VGVAYGSPVTEVQRLIQEAVVGHERVLAHPDPVVVFSDFGDSALIFEVHFWLRMRTLMQRRIVESEIRTRIDERFREAGVVIAFPQRDVHLDAAGPVRIQLVERKEGG